MNILIASKSVITIRTTYGGRQHQLIDSVIPAVVRFNESTGRNDAISLDDEHNILIAGMTDEFLAMLINKKLITVGVLPNA